MSVHRYDKAIIDHFRDILDDERIHILPVELAIRFTAQLRKDDVKFPLISTTRLGYSLRLSDVNFFGLHSGGYQNRNDNGTNTFAQVIPIRINYQMDIFTVDKITGDELVRPDPERRPRPPRRRRGGAGPHRGRAQAEAA